MLTGFSTEPSAERLKYASLKNILLTGKSWPFPLVFATVVLVSTESEQ